MDTTTAAVSLRGLRKRYNGSSAVDGIDLDIEHGEVFALLGPNGAGKTTTVEILEGYRKRDGGEVQVLGRDPGRGDLAWRSRIGIVLQNTGGHDELSVAEVVRHFAGFYPDARDPEDVIASVGLSDKRGTRVRHLSGGQRRRLDVALGILGRPDLLFLDEPTTGFDPEARRDFWKLVASLSADGTTILLTTHYLDEAEHLADRVGVIAAGRLLAVDTPDRLGGREREQAIVRWIGDDGPREAVTATPVQVVGELAAAHGGEVPGLTVSRPTLEDVYLRLIGPASAQGEHELEPA